MGDFCDKYNLESLITEPKCNKTLENPTCIDFLLTNHLGSFQNSFVFETSDLSEFHKTTMTVIKRSFQNLQPSVINYRDNRRFQNNVVKE